MCSTFQNKNTKSFTLENTTIKELTTARLKVTPASKNTIFSSEFSSFGSSISAFTHGDEVKLNSGELVNVTNLSFWSFIFPLKKTLD